jgi:hypothetical protein
MNGQAIRNALNATVHDLANLHMNLPNERLPKEDQFRCLLYHALRIQGMQVYAQARYSIQQRCTCDLVVGEALPRPWIELKVVGSWNSPDVHIQRWNETCDRLSQLCQKEEARKVFLLLHFLDQNRRPTLGNATRLFRDDGPTWISNQANVNWHNRNLIASILEYDLNA